MYVCKCVCVCGFFMPKYAEINTYNGCDMINNCMEHNDNFVHYNIKQS